MEYYGPTKNHDMGNTGDMLSKNVHYTTFTVYQLHFIYT